LGNQVETASIFDFPVLIKPRYVMQMFQRNIGMTMQCAGDLPSLVFTTEEERANMA